MSIQNEDRTPLKIGIDELSEHLKAKVACCSDSMNGSFENLMIGALGVDSGIDYFSRKDNKAVIVRSERPDIQMSALATSTKCLILTGKTAPVPQVLSFAEGKGIPVLLVTQDVLSVVKQIEDVFVNKKLRQQKNLSN